MLQSPREICRRWIWLPSHFPHRVRFQNWRKGLMRRLQDGETEVPHLLVLVLHQFMFYCTSALPEEHTYSLWKTCGVSEENRNSFIYCNVQLVLRKQGFPFPSTGQGTLEVGGRQWQGDKDHFHPPPCPPSESCWQDMAMGSSSLPTSGSKTSCTLSASSSFVRKCNSRPSIVF